LVSRIDKRESETKGGKMSRDNNIKNGKQEMKTEADFHSELYHIFRNLLGNGYTVSDITYSKIIPKQKLENLKEPDLLLEDSTSKPILVIETKRTEENSRTTSITDPFSQRVIEQAMGYAVQLGTPFFATCNKDIFVLFKTFKKFVPLSQRNHKIYYMKNYSDLETFATQLLEDITELQKPQSKVQWTPDHEFLIARLKYLHNILVPHFETTLNNTLKNNSKFAEQYREFIETEGFVLNDARNNITAKESAYLVVNKIFFYKTIENKYRTKITPLTKIDDYYKIQSKLKEYFESVASNVDFKAVFENKSLYNELPFTKEISLLLNEFIEEISHYKLDEIEGDILGMVYKNIIPKDEKKEFGQYYTDSDIAKLIAKLCINDKDDLILDCSCGSGTFLIESYNILKNLNRGSRKDDEELHNKILGQLIGVEINQFPAHLSVMQLTMQNIQVKTKDINIIIRDFFKVNNFFGMQYSKNIDDELIQKGIIPIVDVVLTNPPYIRQEAIKAKEDIRRASLSTKELDEKISKRSDIYVYFFIRALKFLRDKGRLGFITSNSWLDVDFGNGLKKYLSDNSKIEAIIAFDRDVFDDALVNTCITILQKEKDSKERDKNLVSFVRIKKKVDIDKVIGLISNKKPYEDDEVKIILINQYSLKTDQKWTLYHRAPLIYFQIVSNSKISKLCDYGIPKESRIATVSYPYKTGANDFFILDKGLIKTWNIEKKYLKPVITTSKGLKTAKIISEDNPKYLLMVNKPKPILKDENANVLDYIIYGENKEIDLRRGKDKGATVKGYNSFSSLANKKLWYALEDKEPAPILFQHFFRKRIIVFDNPEKMYAIHNFYNIKPLNEEHKYPILAYLNSSIGELCIEMNGRYLGNGLIDMTVDDVEALPVLNPNMLTSSEQNKLKRAFLKYAENNDKRIIDEVLYEILKVNSSQQKDIHSSLIDLREIRKSVKKGIKEKDSIINSSITRKKPKLLKKSKEVKQLTSLKRWLEKDN